MAEQPRDLRKWSLGYYTAQGRKTIERHPGHLPPYHALIAAAALQGDTLAATESITDLLRLRPDFSLAWADKNLPLTGDIRERLLDGLRRAGVPEE